jgi:putative transposase
MEESMPCQSPCYQEDYHRKVKLQDELRALFRRHEVEFDERHVWD